MSVHYKFKSALDFDTITFDGLHISVADLKKAIMQQKRLGKTAEFDLQITNAQTKEEYAEETALIPKNTSLTIARIPLANQTKKQWNPQAQEDSNANASRQTDTEQVHVDLSRMNGTEEDKIAAMMMQSTMDYDPNNYQRLRLAQTGEVPPTYRCFKCHQPGHWIKNCPLGNTPIEGQEHHRKTTGIPRSFINDQKQAELEAKPQPAPVEKKPEIPDDLICSICKDLFNDAVMIPCCGSSFCDECVRTSLLESEDNECPDCHEKGSSPGSLIPNRFLRTSVNSFRNETGYNNRPRQATATVVVPQKPRIEETVQDENSKFASPRPVEEEREPSVEKQDNQRSDREDTPERRPRNGSRERHEADDHSDSHAEKDESEDDDNITVTVPPAHQQSRTAFRDRQVNGWSMMRGGMRPDYDRVSRVNYNNQQGRTLSQEDKDAAMDRMDRGDDGRGQMALHRRTSREEQPSRDRREHSHNDGGDRQQSDQHQMSGPQRHGGPGGDLRHGGHDRPSHDVHPGGGGNDQQRYNRPMYNDQGPRPGGGGGYDNLNYHGGNNNQNMPPGTGGNMNQYGGGGEGPRMNYDGNMPIGGQQQQQFNRGGPPLQGQPGYNNRFPNPNQNYGMRPGPAGPPGMAGGSRHPVPSNPINDQLSNIYQGVAAKVGTGIIDDPLEAFNRIMREKEMRKEGERRRSPGDQRRSRSIEMNRRRGSPERRHVSPRRSPDRRARVDRRRRSSSFSSSRSRSRSRPRNRSRSPQMRKRSRSPPVQIRRSRSRSPPFDQRNRGRDMRPNNNFHRDERNFHDHHQQHNPHHHQQQQQQLHHHHNPQQQQQQQMHQRGNDFNRNRGGGRGWNNGPNNRYHNDPQPPYSHNNSSGAGGHNYDGPHENYMHHEQPQQHYQQNRYDRDPHHNHPQQQQQQQQQQFYNHPHQQYMDRRSPNDQPPVPGVDDDRPTVQQQQQQQQHHRRDQGGRPGDMGMDRREQGGRGVEMGIDRREQGGRGGPEMGMDRREQGGRGVEMDRRQPQQSRPIGSRSVSPHADSRSRDFSGERRRRSRSPQGNRQQVQIKQEVAAKDRRGEQREHRDRDVTEAKGSARKSQPDKRAQHPRVESKDRERKVSVSRQEKEKEKHEVKEKEKKRDSSEPDAKKVKDKSKKKKKTSEKDKDREKKKSKKEKKEKKSKRVADESKVLSDPEPKLREIKVEKIEEQGPDSVSKDEQSNDFTDPPESQCSPISEIQEGHKQNDTMESSKASSPGAENPSDSVLDIYNMDYEKELEDMAEGDKSKSDEKKPAGHEMPELSKWERDDQSAGEEPANRSPKEPEEEHEEGEIDDDNKVTNEVLKRAENALFSRAINAIRPIEIRAISSDRKKLYSDSDLGEPLEKVIVQTRSSQSPESKPNVQITVAMLRSSSTERSVEVVEQKRDDKREQHHRNPTPPSQPQQQQRKLSVKERLGMKVTEERRRRSPSPVRKVRITASGDEGPNRSSERERDVPGGRQRRRPSPPPQGNRNRSPVLNRSRNEDRGGRNMSGNNSLDRRGDHRDQHRMGQRDSNNSSRDAQRTDPQRAMGSNQQQRDSNRDRGMGRQGGRSPPRRDIARKEDPQERRRSRERMQGREDRGDQRENMDRERKPSSTTKEAERRKPAERKRSRTVSPVRESLKKSKREEGQGPKRDEDRKKQPIDESNFEPDYEQMDTDMAREERSRQREQPVAADSKSLVQPPPAQKDEEPATKKKSKSPKSSSSDSSSDSSSGSEEVDETKRRRKKSKHSKKSKKNKRGNSSDSEERKKSKKSKSKKSKKKKKHKHK